MSFEIIPAIDLLDSKVVRLFKGKYSEETVFSDDPVKVAKNWEQDGAQRIHLVDLNGAREGSIYHLEIIKKIAESTSIPIQVGGGIRSLSNVEELLDAGVDRVILGSIIIKDRNTAIRAISEYGDSVICGIDSLNGQILIQGWEENSNIESLELARELVSVGATRFIHTDISRDGTLEGPNINSMKEFSGIIGDIPLIASGGIGSLDDIRNISSINIEGVIVGRALYTGDVKLPDALRIGNSN